jgi:cytochrome c556
MYRTKTKRMWREILISGAVLLTSCRSSAPPVSQKTSAEPPSPTASRQFAQHWVQDSKLRALMDGMSKQTTALPAGNADAESAETKLERESFQQAAMLADTLSQTALQLPQIVKRDKLSEADQRGFDGEARTLHDLALQLKDAARANKIERMQNVLTNISSTCMACHTHYRDLTGALEPRASLDPRTSIATGIGR